MVDEVRRDEGINVVRVLRHAIESANTRIVEDARSDESLFGMGTTLVAAAVVGEFAYVANVGDSRLYLINDGIRQVTRDHSLVEEMIRMGEIRPEEARTHPDKNIITRAIGAEDTVDIDFFEVELKQGDTLLMCSDGLSNMVEDERIGELVRASGGDLAQKGEALVREANQNGGKDNIAIILVEI